VATRLAVLALSVAMGGVLYFSFRTFMQPHVVVMEQPLAVTPPVVRPGDPITVTAAYCKPESSLATVGYFLTTEEAPLRLIPLPMGVSALPEGCHRAVLVLQVPSYTPPGRYVLHVAPEYHSLFSRARYNFRSVPFDVW
jgi:hypothetical protein